MTKAELIGKIRELYYNDEFNSLMKDFRYKCYIDCAEKVMTEEFGLNKELAIEFYKKDEEECDDYFNCIKLAESIVKNLNDKEWATEIYKKIEEKYLNDDSNSFKRLAESIIKNLNDREWAIKLYKKAEKEGIYFSKELAESIIKNLNDKEWAIKLYEKAERECTERNEFKELAESIIKNLNDKEWAIEIYKKSRKGVWMGILQNLLGF
jgi:hypothetical protein